MLPAQSQDFGTPNPVPLANPYPSGVIQPLIRSLISSSENSIRPRWAIRFEILEPSRWPSTSAPASNIRLKTIVLHKRGLYGMQNSLGAEALDCGDLRTLVLGGQSETREDSFPVAEHGASAASSLIAASFRARQAERFGAMRRATTRAAERQGCDRRG